MIFGEKISTKRFLGMLMAFGGIVYYTHVKIMGNAKKKGGIKKVTQKKQKWLKKGNH